MDPRIEEIVADLRRSRKYSSLAEAALQRIAAWALRHHTSVKAASEAARSKLHQAYGAYLTPRDLARVESLVRELPASAPRTAVREVARQILSHHASSRERLAFLDGLYPQLLGGSRPCTRVVDLACGLHPFALPWMGLSPEVEYHACDIDERLTGAIRAFFASAGHAGTVQARDLLAGPLPPILRRADVAFFMKTMPCLERQEPGVSLHILRAVDAPRVVVSFPARSLGGREKGMREQYALMIQDVARALAARMECLAFPTETFYVLQR